MKEKLYKFAAAYVAPQTWTSDFCLRVNAQGIITESGAMLDAKGADTETVANGLLIPGFISTHSHAFQFAMAGQTEFAGPQGPSE